MSLEQDLLEQRERNHKLFKQLEDSPETEIIGVVSARGVGGSFTRGDDLWTLLFSFSGWKQAGGALQKSELTIRKPVPEGRIAYYQNRMNPYDVVRIRARLCEEGILGSPQALLLDWIGKDASDAEINACAQELQKPVTFADPQLGVFTLNRAVNWYETTSVWGDHPVRLMACAADAEPLEKALDVARSLWGAQRHWQEKVAGYAAEKLLGLKNDSWLGEDEIPLTAPEFARRMTVREISVNPDGSFAFWHDDGDLFWGHCIVVSGNLTDGLQDASIEG